MKRRQNKKNKAKLISKEKREAFNKLSKEEKEKIRLELKLKKNKYEYIEDAIKNKIIKKKLLKLYKNGKIKTVDPGKRAPMTILGKGELRKNKTGKKRKQFVLYTYSAGTRIRALKRLRYIKLIENKKNKTMIDKKTLKEMEKELSIYNSKTVNYEKFIEYGKKKIMMRRKISIYENNKKIEINEKTKKEIENKKNMVNKMRTNKIERKEIDELIEYNKYVQKLRWFGYINKQRHEDELLNDIEEVYGKDAVFVFGDWSGKGRTKRMSMPNMGMKKLLEKRFEVYLIDEYNTSKIGWKMKEEGKPTKVELKKDGESCGYKEIDSVLTFKMSTETYGLINRDYNATKNMQEIVKNLLETEKRPMQLDTKIDNS